MRFVKRIGAGMFGRASNFGGDGPEGKSSNGDDLYKKAAQEGIVNFYGNLAQINAEKILPVLRRGIRVSAAVPNNL